MLAISATINIGLFGKTPTEADFVRFNAGSPPARAYDEWMNASLSEMRRGGGGEWEAVFDAAAPLSFVGRPSGDPRLVLAGHIRPSRDQSGRRYPLTVFCEIQLDRQGRGVQILPYALNPFLDAAARFSATTETRALDAAILKAMAALVPENPVELARGMADHLREVTMESFWSAFFGSFDDPRKYLCIKNLFGTLAPLRGYAPKRLSMGLRLPGVASDSALKSSLVMASWISLCRAVIGEESLASAWLFWHSGQGAARPGCFLFFRAPAPTALSAMLDPGHTTESIWDMESLGRDRTAEARDALGPAITTVLDAPQFAMLEFIQRI